MKIFFEVKTSRYKVELWSYVIFYFLTMLFYFLFRLPIINLAVNIFGLLLITMNYSGSIKKKFFAVAAIYSINMVCDTISAFTFSNYTIGQDISEIFQIFTLLLIIICQLIIIKLVPKKSKIEFVAPYWWILFLIPLNSIIMLFFLLYRNINDRILIVVESIGILFVNIIVFNLYNALFETYIQLLEKGDLKQQLDIYAHQLEIIMQTQNRIRSLQHDMKHHTKELYSMANNNNNKEMMSYLDSMTEFLENPDEYAYSENKEVDSVLNYMLQKANTVLKQVNAKVCIPKNLKISTFNLNIILGNLLENAIEAASKSEDKILDIKIKMEKEILFINISNSFSGNIEKKNDKFITTKPNKEYHGIGLENVKKIVEIYDGEMDVIFENNFFEVMIMLYIEK